MTDHPIRPAFWNVPLWGEIGVYVLGFTAVALLIAGILRNRRLWLRGAEDPHPVKDRRARLFSVIADVFTQKKIRETSAGRLHAVLAWGFFLLFCGTALATLDWDVGHYVFDAQFLQGGFYLAYKFVLDCAGIAVLIALALGAARRWSKESGLPGDARFVCAYLSLAFIVLTGFLVEGIRLAATLPAWSVYSPIGHLVAKMLLACGLSEAELRLLHTWIWTIHGISSLAFIAAVPLTYYAHVYRTPAGLFTREEKPAGLLRKIDDIEEQETFGVSSFSQFTTRERTAFDACTECGRCTAACPAVRAGTPLDPRALIVSLRDRMHMEENLQGMPVLCVMAQADRQPKLNAARNAFEGAGVLMLEDLDLWMSPMVESAGDDLGGFIMASLSRGAREAISLIRSAVENPDVFVLASSSEAGEIDPFFFDLLEPLSVIDIDFPTVSERDDIWMEIAREHPSLRGIDRASLVRYSAQMPRYDMYMAAREAIEEAYKASLVARRYLPVTADNLYDKLAAYQPLDSDEYRALEEAVVSDFRRELEHLEDLLDGEEGN